MVDRDGEGDQLACGLASAASVALPVELDRLPAACPSRADLREEDGFGLVVDVGVAHRAQQLDETELVGTIGEQPQEAAWSVRAHGCCLSTMRSEASRGRREIWAL